MKLVAIILSVWLVAVVVQANGSIGHANRNPFSPNGEYAMTLFAIVTGHYPDPEEDRYIMRLCAALVIILACGICSL